MSSAEVVEKSLHDDDTRGDVDRYDTATRTGIGLGSGLDPFSRPRVPK